MKKILKFILYTVILIGIIIGALELFSSYTPSRTIHADAPVTTKQQLFIKAPPEKVWKLLSDINQWPSWQHEITSATLNDTLGENSSFNWKSGGLTIHSTLHTVEAPHKLGWSGTAFGSFAIHNWSLLPAEGGTIVSVEESMEGWLVWTLSGTFQTGLHKTIKTWLALLKAEAEK